MIQLSDQPSLYPHQLSLNQNRRGGRNLPSSLLSRSPSALLCVLLLLAESDNNKINFQQLQLKEKRAHCFLSEKHRELECQPVISNTWKTLCSLPAKLMKVFYFNGCALKGLLVHHGNEVWGSFSPDTLGLVFWGFFHISPRGNEAVWAVKGCVCCSHHTPVTHTYVSPCD